MTTKENEVMMKVMAAHDFRMALTKLIEDNIEGVGIDALIMNLELAKLKLATFHLSNMYNLPELHKIHEKEIRDSKPNKG